MKKLGASLFGNRDFDLHNIVSDLVNDIFINAHFIGISMKLQAMFFGICKDFLIPFWDSIPCSFMECPQVFPARCEVQPGLVREKWDFDKEPGIIVKASALQAGNRDHGAIRCFMEAAEMVFFCLGGNEFYFLFKGSILIDVYSHQAAFLLFYYADAGQINGQKRFKIMAVIA